MAGVTGTAMSVPSDVSVKAEVWVGGRMRMQGWDSAVVCQLMHQGTVTLLLLLFHAGASVSADIGVNVGVSNVMHACSYKQGDDSDDLVIVGRKGKNKINNLYHYHSLKGCCRVLVTVIILM